MKEKDNNIAILYTLFIHPIISHFLYICIIKKNLLKIKIFFFELLHPSFSNHLYLKVWVELIFAANSNPAV